MKIIDVRKESVVAGQDIVLDLCNNKPGDTVVGDIYLYLAEDNVVTIDGAIDGDSGQELKAIDMANYAVADGISEAGYYMIPASGLATIKFTFENDGEVVIKETF